MTTEIKNEVALWALNELTRRAEQEFADQICDIYQEEFVPGIDNSASRFKAIAEAVEVAGRLELVARAYIYPNLPSEEDAAAYATHAAAMIATPDPIKCEALTKAVNAVCTCGGGPPGECCQACEVYHMVKAEQGDEEAEEAVEEVPK